MIVRKFGGFVERSAEPLDELTENELLIQNIGKGAPLLADQPLPLPRGVIREAIETLLVAEGNPERVEWLKVALVFLRDYGDCVVSLERGLHGLLKQFDELHAPTDKFTKADVEVAIKDYLTLRG